MIEQFVELTKKPDEKWPHRSLCTHKVLAALYRAT